MYNDNGAVSAPTPMGYFEMSLEEQLLQKHKYLTKELEKVEEVMALLDEAPNTARLVELLRKNGV